MTDPPPLLLANATILPSDGRPAFAGCVELQGGQIASVRPGGATVCDSGATPARLDCGGRLLVPGFVDAHMHVLATAAALAGVDCSPAVAPSIEALLDILRAPGRDVPPGAWLRARGYHEAMLDERRHPTRRDLDRVVADRPVRLVHASGHASVLNSVALCRLGITSATEEPPGARIDREIETGEPSGLLIEMEDWLDQRLPRPDPGEISRLVVTLSERLLARGVTAVQDLGHRNDGARAAFLGALVQEHRFRPQLTLASGFEAFARGDCAQAPGLALGPVKIMLNETGGQLHPNPSRLAEMVLSVHRAGRQVAIHAVEARAVRAAIDAIEAALLAQPRLNHRHRIEHAAVTPADLAERIAALGIVVVSNPAFLWESGERYQRSLPAADLPHLYDTAGLRRAGVRVAVGADAPVAPPDALLAIRAACARRSSAGTRLPGATLSFSEALDLITHSAAYAAFQETDRGAIAPGQVADLLLLDGDPGDAAGVSPALTILGGRVVWRAGADKPCEAAARKEPMPDG